MDPTTPENTREFDVPVEKIAPELGEVTLTTDEDDNLVLTVVASDNAGLASLEVDHSLEDILPEFTVGTEDVTDEETGASSTFDEATGTWTLNFGPQVSKEIRENAEKITFYFVITDVNGNEFGSMDPTTPENTREFDVPVEKIAPELGEVTLTTDEDDNLVLTVVASDNAGLASLEVDHSLEDILPEFTVGTEDVTDEETGASSTFDEATGTWTLNFGPQVSKEIRENAEKITFYFVITDVNGNEFGSMDPTTPENTREFDVPVEKIAPELENVTLTTDEDDNLVLTVVASDNAGLASLEVDHSLEDILPEFTVGTEDVTDEETGASSTFDEATGTWTLNFGPQVSKEIRENAEKITFYFVITDVNGNEFGSMDPTTPENTREFDVPVEKIAPELENVTLTTDEDDNLVLTVVASDNAGLASLEVDHSLEDILPEFTVGTEDVTDEETGASSTFDEATGTWTLNFGPQVSKEIRENAEKITFYFVITDVNGNEFGSMDPTTPENTREFDVPVEKIAPELENVTLTTDEDDNLVLTVVASDNAGLASLEVDHSLEDILPEFTVGTEDVTDEETGASSTFDEATGTWTLNFGPQVSKEIRENAEKITFYFVITDVNGNEFGSMDPTTPENTREFDVPVEKIAPELGEVTLTTDEDDNLVLTVVASDNAGLASLEVDHSLEDILPEFTVGTEDVTDEETGASSTFDEATGTWTLNFGPQVSKEIRENAEKITFYFVITDVNGNEFGSMDPTTPENTREFDVPVEKIAPELENVTLTTDEDDNLVLTVVASDNAGLASLEVDHSLEDILPEFTVGTEDVTDEETGASSTFDEATGTWTLNFGPQVSKEIRENAEKITFYFVITDVNGNEFGSMDPTTPENTREFDVPVEKIAPELGEVTLTTDEDDNLVLTVVASDNAGLASLEVDHSLEDILPEFTVGTEDVTDEETGASSTFDEATGTWTLNFGPQVSKEIRENAEKITFYFVITDVNGNEFGSMDPTTPENTREFDVPVEKIAPELENVTLTTDEDDNLVLTVVASDNAGLASLEVDHSLEDILPEFTVGTEDVTDEETGASSTFDEATGTWTLNFGPQVSKEIRENAEKITFYFVITDVNGNEFGSMDPTTPENTREFDVPVEKIAPELENVTLTTDEDDNLVLTVVASDNAGLASLEVDHSLEDILPEFTVGTEDVTDEETGASSTFDEATGTWTLNFGPQVSKEIRENAEKITFYFVITDVNGNEFGSMDPTTPENTREFDVPVEKIAPELENVTLTTDEDDNLVLTVVASDNAGLASLEVDHSLEDILPEFTVGTEDVTDEETGASSTFDEATGTWTLNFGPQVSKEIRENAEKITFYFVITDVNGNEFGSMDPTTPENTREFDVPVEKIAPELGEVTLTTDEDDNLVLTVVASDNAGLASLEVDHSLEDILPEFTVGTEDVTDEETGASSTFDEATGTWTLNFGPQVSKEIRENAEKITFYFVITDVNGNEFGSMDPTTPENTREFDVPVEKIAPELENVTLTTDEDDNLVLTVVASDNAGLASLEVDHSLEDILPEFTVGTEDVTDEETGASSTFDEATGTWTLNFGPQVSKEIRENAEKITFYFVITDVNGNEFGSMDPTTPENTREFDVPVEKIAPELGEVTLTTDEDDNLVLTVVASDNAGLASLEVDHSLEDILPEFTVGTEDVTDEETGASSTFDEATGTWTLNFGPQVSKEIRENAEKITFYFVITDVNGNEFGSMDPTTPENTREFDVPVEKIAPELGEVTLTTDEDDNLVLTVVASDNAGLASLEVDHSLEDILPEFTVGTEDVTDEETGASSTFDEATGTWTLNFGPQVSKEIRENAEKITFYFVITDVNGNEFGSMDPTTPENTREFDVPVEKIAPELENVTLTTDEDDNLVLTVVASDNAGLASLEVDHSLEDILPEFTVGTEDVTDEETGASSTFDEATGTWTLNFGPQVSKEIRENAEKITFYFVITDVNGNEFGSMDPTTPENTREFDVPVEKIAPELENVTLTTDEDDNLVLTVVASDNAGLASLEVDHSLEDILPEFTVGTEDVTDEETGASSTFDEATGTWTLNFGPQVSKEIRENAEKITFYFVITDVNGNEFGSMDPTTPENTREFDVPVSVEAEALAAAVDGTTMTGDLRALTATFPTDVPAFFDGAGYKINSEIVLAGDVNGEITITRDGTDLVIEEGLTAGTYTYTELVQKANGGDEPSAADFDTSYAGKSENYAITVSGNTEAIDTTVTIRSIISDDDFSTREVLAELELSLVVDVVVTGVSIDEADQTLEVGDTFQFNATVAPSDATNQNVTWSSSNETVATVDANGLVTAVAAGTATITVTTVDGSFTATTVVTVYKKIYSEDPLSKQ